MQLQASFERSSEWFGAIWDRTSSIHVSRKSRLLWTQRQRVDESRLHVAVVCGSDTVEYLAAHLPSLCSIVCVARDNENPYATAAAAVPTSRAIDVITDPEQPTLSSSRVRSWTCSWWDAILKGDCKKQQAAFELKLVHALDPAVWRWLRHKARHDHALGLRKLLLAFLKRCETAIACVCEWACPLAD